MKSYKGILLLTVSIVLTVYVWLATGMTNFVTPGLALTTLSWTFMLATRSRLLENSLTELRECTLSTNFLPSYQLFSLSSTTSVQGVYRGPVQLVSQETLTFILSWPLQFWPFLVKVSNTRLGVGFIGWFTQPIFLVSPMSI